MPKRWYLGVDDANQPRVNGLRQLPAGLLGCIPPLAQRPLRKTACGLENVGWLQMMLRCDKGDQPRTCKLQRAKLTSHGGLCRRSCASLIQAGSGSACSRHTVLAFLLHLHRVTLCRAAILCRRFYPADNRWSMLEMRCGYHVLSLNYVPA